MLRLASGLQAVHAWPDNWQVSDPNFMTSWIDCHIEASASIGKPMILEEVLPTSNPKHGKAGNVHDQAYVHPVMKPSDQTVML